MLRYNNETPLVGRTEEKRHSVSKTPQGTFKSAQGFRDYAAFIFSDRESNSYLSGSSGSVMHFVNVCLRKVLYK